MGSLRRTLAGWTALLAATGCAGEERAAPIEADAVARPAPNVLIYVIDTLRADGLGCYGGGGRTPAIDRLAAEGARCERALAQSAWTRPSVASLLSGDYPEVHGVEGKQHVLSDAVVLVSERFAERGWATAAIGTNPQVGSFFGFDQGFDRFVELYGRRDAGVVRQKELVASAREATSQALTWLESVEGPFLLVVHTIDPHAPYEPPPPWAPGSSPDSRAEGSAEWLAREDLTDADRRRIRALYSGEVSFADEEVGRIVDALAEQGRLDDTILVVTSDHGEEFWEHGRHGHGQSLADELLRVPLVVRYPPRVPAGTVVRGVVESVDVVPTVLALAGLSVPDSLDGRPFLPEAGADPQEAFASLHHQELDLLALERPPWKLVWDRAAGRRSLYDLRDPGPERPDRSAEQPERLRELSARLEELVRRNAKRALGPTTIALDEIPRKERRALEALGYFGGDGD